VIALLAAGLGWSARVPLWIGAFFLLGAVVEFLNGRWNERASSAKETPGNRSSHLPAPGEFGEFVWRGETNCFGTVMRLGGRDVCLDLRRDKLIDERKNAARTLIAQAEQLAASFEAFKIAEARRQPKWADEISKHGY